ncbi:MAG: hypothetical protein OXU74_07250 [Gemmatimonadota bacterium]|nr:hypothetical protein [Gemmatimonadota bacterium]
MRRLAVVLAALVGAVCCGGVTTGEMDYDFGPLHGRWNGEFDYAGETYSWELWIDQYNRLNPTGRFTGRHVTSIAGDTVATDPVTGAYNPPRVTMTFAVELPGSPLSCEYHGQLQDSAINGRISCKFADDTAVVDQAMMLSRT